MEAHPKIEIELNAELVSEINRLREYLTKIEFYTATGCLQDSFDEIKRLAREAMGDIIRPLPCPFCGSSAEINAGCFGERFVACSNEKCGGSLGSGIWFNNDTDAILAWNRRRNAHGA